MGLSCSSSNHRPQIQKINEIKLPIMIAENFINIIGQLELSDDIPDELRYNLNQLIILRSKLAHCVVRIQRRNSHYHFIELENELTNVINFVHIVIQDFQLEVYFPLITSYLIEELDIYKQNSKQQVQI
ncbi:unnamed protein product [Paramecium sonneborni]|uniref:Uncharacterized protein n=1 Tax=Paramecium sonneborni TaxID=65129 RepID=A0A8S1M719_9CILI|nr:unnamed protein product [Paramecium sonneborni]